MLLSSPPIASSASTADSVSADPRQNADRDAAPVCENIIAPFEHHHRGSSEGELDHDSVLARFSL